MDLIEEFIRCTDTGLSPERYRRWTILVTVAAVLDRRVYTAIRRGKVLFPNLYVLFVGPPGAGKTMAILPGIDLLETQNHVDLAPNHTSYEAFIRRLAQRALEVDRESAVPRRRATMAMFLSEWGTFIRKPENDQLAMLSDIYDSGNYKAETIGRGMDNAENLYINILAACTPAWFAEGFPPNSYEQGLPTRLILIYEAQPVVRKESFIPYVCSLDDPLAAQEDFQQRFWPELEKIASLRGFVSWSSDALAAFNLWGENGWEPQPQDPMLSGYCMRRDLHVAKIAVLFAVARHPGQQEVLLEDYESAKEILLDAEKTMPMALSAAGGNIYQLRMQMIATYVEKRYLETKQAVPEWEVRQRMSRLMDPLRIRTTIDEMINQQMIRAWGDTKAPSRKLTPGVTR